MVVKGSEFTLLTLPPRGSGEMHRGSLGSRNQMNMGLVGLKKCVEMRVLE